MTSPTPLPLLRDLPVGIEIQRCKYCGKLVFQTEACTERSSLQKCFMRPYVIAGMFANVSQDNLMNVAEELGIISYLEQSHENEDR